MFPMSPLESWGFLIMVGSIIALWIEVLFEKHEPDDEEF